MGSRSGDDINISPKYKIVHWKALNLSIENPDETDWNTAVRILDDRISARFVKPAQYLIDAPFEGSQPTFGFAILALDFLVMETIQGFKEGLPNHVRKSQFLIVKFLKNWTDFQRYVTDSESAKKKAERLYFDGRCALHHSGTTDNLTVGVTGEMITFSEHGSIHINRTVFHERLFDEFKRYLAELRNPASSDLREKFRKKMNSICGMQE